MPNHYVDVTTTTTTTYEIPGDKVPEGTSEQSICAMAEDFGVPIHSEQGREVRHVGTSEPTT